MELYYALSLIVAWILATVIKIATTKNIQNGFKSGGMPSQHTSAISSITFAIYLVEGLSSTFFLAFVILFIVMIDASTVRFSVGRQAETLNNLIKNESQKLAIIRGHTRSQVLVGFVIGALTSYVLYFLW